METGATRLPGGRVGTYAVVGTLGAGGMGEVYRATDTRLGRDVAIKVLPAELAGDPERLARFEREAKLLASLNHPNIAHVYGFESTTLESGGSVHFLAMELVEGEDLSERLKRGAIPVEEALAIARQIAEALEEAHEHGIVHRDLKPANVKVTPDGKVKVLDFGLAKAFTDDPSTSSPEVSHSPTMSAQATRAGVILGTAAYMSPEQARGKAVDKRADIWAFGAVLWEMITGRQLFAGETVSDVLAGVLKTEIDFAAVPAETAPAIHRLLRGCLERNPKNRLHDIADARLALDDAHAEGRDEPPASRRATGGARGWPPRLAVGAALLAIGAAGGWLLNPRSPQASAGTRWALALPEGDTLSTADTPQLALSRDGSLQAAVVVAEDGVPRLLVHGSDEFEPRFLAGAEGASAPFFSPDGAWIGFFREDALVKIPVAGGPPVRLATIAGGAGRGGTWSTDGFIYFSDNYAAGLSRVGESGGKVQAVTRLDGARSERTHRWPEALPGGEAVVFTCDTLASTEYYDDARIEAVRPASGERRVLVEGASQARYAPGGHLVFARGGSLFAVAFDPHTLEVKGTPRPVAEGVATNVGSGAVQFALSDTGAALWAPGGLSASYRIVWVDRHGAESAVPVPPAPYQELALSPDGTRLALVGGPGGVSDLWVADLERGAQTRLTSGEFVQSPVWTPDGSRIAFAVLSPGAGEGRSRIDWRLADGSQEAETLVPEGATNEPSAFTPDGRTLIYDQVGRKGGQTTSSLWALPLDGARTARALGEGPSVKQAGTISPDGRWLAYVSDESGQDNVYVRPFPQGEGRWQVSIPQGDEPRWGPGGREIYYRSDSVLYRVAIDTSHGFKAGRPEPYLDRVASGGRVQSYGISRDGSRIVTMRTAEGSRARRVLYLDLGFAQRLDAAAR